MEKKAADRMLECWGLLDTSRHSHCTLIDRTTGTIYPCLHTCLFSSEELRGFPLDIYMSTRDMKLLYSPWIIPPFFSFLTFEHQTSVSLGTISRSSRDLYLPAKCPQNHTSTETEKWCVLCHLDSVENR